MVAQNVFFYAIAAVIVYSGIRVVTSKNVVHAALHLVAVLASVAAQYILLAAEFVAVAQVLVYIGAIVVLFLFGIMLTRAKLGADQDLTHKHWLGGAATALLLFVVMAYALIDEYGWTRTPMPADPQITTVNGSNTATVSDSLFSSYLIPFEVVSVLLLAALVGAIVLAREGLTVDDLLLNQFLLLGAVLFCIGVYGVLARRNAVLVLMSIELILNAVNINLIAFGAIHGSIAGSVFALFVIAIAAAEVGVGLAIVLLIYRNRRTVDLDDLAGDEGLMFLLEHAYFIPLIPAASFFLILFFGKRMPFKGAEIGITALGICFVLAVATNVQWHSYVNDAEHTAEAQHEAEPGVEGGGEEHGLGEGESASAAAPAAEDEVEFEVAPVVKTWTWWTSGGVDFTAGMLLDGPAVMMLFVVTIISLLVHIYSTDYVGGDRRYTHYFAFLSLFSASMLGLIMSESTLQLLTCWELVGLCSFALIGHWWEEKPNSDAALKAFITNRVGDVGLICGVIILFYGAGQTFDIVTINDMAANGEISHLVLLVASCSLITAVMSKSGQFILHTWLPDAMAGPTPVSALIHAATMVVAGIFMVARLYSVFFEGLSIGTSNVNLLAVVGGVTVIGGAALAFVQNDIKKVLAYSTVSQLGYMVMALGVGAWTAALFHLFTHAMFKAGLFLGSGSVAHSVHSFDMKEDMGGMRKFMPKTYVTFLICTAALIGIFPLAGFWSKDEILAGAQQLGGDGGYSTFLIVGLIGAFMTAAYMTRCVYLTFFGEPRGHAADTAHPPHESGPVILVPLYILSALAIVGGLVNLPKFSWLPAQWALRFEHYYEPKGPYFPSGLNSFAHPEFNIWVALVAGLLGLLGIGLAYAWYFRGLGPHGITHRNKLARTGHTVLVQKYYFDWLYTDVIVHAVKGPIARAAYWFNQKVLDGVVNGAGTSAVRSGQFVYDKIDQGIVDTIVDGSGTAAEGSGQFLRLIQTGRVQQYAALLFAAAAVLAGIFIIVI